MGKTKTNSALQGLSGKIDGWVYRQVEGDIIVARRPQEREAPVGEKEARTNIRFARAAEYSRSATAAKLKPRYAAVAPKRCRWNTMSNRDFLIPPVIDDVSFCPVAGGNGQAIVVLAHDDFEVRSVHVRIVTAAAAEIERGAATLQPDGYWHYVTARFSTSEAPLTVEVTALDWPENAVIRTLPLPAADAEGGALVADAAGGL
jgi:hypothetical protein